MGTEVASHRFDGGLAAHHRSFYRRYIILNVGFSESKQYEVAMKSVSCASSIMLDDLLTGNVT